MKFKFLKKLFTGLSLFMFLSISNISYAGLIMNIYEDAGGLNLQFSGDINISSLAGAGEAFTSGYLDFNSFNGTTGWIGFRQSPGVLATQYVAGSSNLISNVSNGFGNPVSTYGTWSLLSGTTWFDSFAGNLYFLTTQPALFSGVVSVDAHMVLAGGSLAASGFNPRSSFVRTIQPITNNPNNPNQPITNIPTAETITLNVAAVPEPGTLAIFALGMIGLASRRFKK